MASYLSFVRGLEYAFRVYNRVFGEQLFMLTSGAANNVNPSGEIGGTWDSRMTSGISYLFVKADGSSYTGDVNFHEAHQKLYTGTTYSVLTSEQLDVAQVAFTPGASHPDTMYIQSALDANMGTPIYLISGLGEVINPEQYYYLLGIGRDAALTSLSFYEAFIDKYISDVLPAGVQGKEYTT